MSNKLPAPPAGMYSAPKAEYQLITGSDAVEFSKKITDFLNSGYAVLGSPLFCVGESSFFAQAVIKK